MFVSKFYSYRLQFIIAGYPRTNNRSITIYWFYNKPWLCSRLYLYFVWIISRELNIRQFYARSIASKLKGAAIPPKIFQMQKKKKKSKFISGGSGGLLFTVEKFITGIYIMLSDVWFQIIFSQLQKSGGTILYSILWFAKKCALPLRCYLPFIYFSVSYIHFYGL